MVEFCVKHRSSSSQYATCVATPLFSILWEFRFDRIGVQMISTDLMGSFAVAQSFAAEACHPLMTNRTCTQSDASDGPVFFTFVNVRIPRLSIIASCCCVGCGGNGKTRSTANTCFEDWNCKTFVNRQLAFITLGALVLASVLHCPCTCMLKMCRLYSCR